MKKKLFPEVDAEKLASLSDEEIEALAKAHEDVFLQLRPEARTEDVVGELTMGEVLEQARDARTVLESLRGIQAERIAGATEFEAELEKLVSESTPVAAGESDEPVAEVPVEAEVAAETPVEEVTATDEHGVTEQVGEPVLAAANLKAARPRLPQAPVSHRPLETQTDASVPFLIASGVPGFGESQPANGLEDIAKALHAKRYQGASTAQGVREKVLVARADWSGLYPEDRKIQPGMDPYAVRRAMDAVTGEITAITASGGLCAPVTPYYQLANVSVPSRPVRDAMVQFNANRGGLQYARPAVLGDLAGSVGIKTATEDAAGGTFAEKDCLSVECPDFTTTTVDMIYRCLTFGNLNARAFPELITQWTELSMAYHARVADSALLDAIGAGSTAVTQAQIYGATSSVIDAILFAAAGMRSRNRMDPNARFDVLLPAWAEGLIAADVVNSQFNRFDVKPGNVGALLSSYGVDITWYLDTETGAGQIFGAQSAGALLDFPSTAVWYIFPKGSWLFLDGGVLDLGIVRDSVLNSTNDFQIFLETFEAAAFVGVESLKVTSTVCYSGAVAAPATAITC